MNRPELTKAGDVQPWVLALGAVQHFGGPDVPRASLTREHGAYIVRGFRSDGSHAVEGFALIREARRFGRDVARPA